MGKKSYYETVAKTIRTSLYPNGVQNSLMVKYARQSEFGREFPPKKKQKKTKIVEAV